MYKYYILAFIHGCLLKIYDDLYDNNLYAFFNISKEKLTTSTNQIVFGIHFNIIKK